MNSHKLFTNKSCKYFPCHDMLEDDFNCLFCYCPLYVLNNKCGGNFSHLDDGTKDCSKCEIIHNGEIAWEHVQTKISLITEIGKEK